MQKGSGNTGPLVFIWLVVYIEKDTCFSKGFNGLIWYSFG